MKATSRAAVRSPVRGWWAFFAGAVVGVLSAAPALAHLAGRVSRAEDRASRDPLTGISNRGAMLRAFGDLVAVGRSPTVLIVDLDRFKQVNDGYGHLVGDRLICTVAARLQQWARRRGDLVGRLGGDEFVVLSHDTWVAGAVGAARQARQIIAEPVAVEYDHRRVLVTPSATVGVAVATHDWDWVEALRAADVALYHAKRAQTGYAVFDSALAESSPQGPHVSAEGTQRLGARGGRSESRRLRRGGLVDVAGAAAGSVGTTGCGGQSASAGSRRVCVGGTPISS